MDTRNKGGRPKASRDKTPRQTVARKLAIEAASRGLTPLDVMLEAMRHFAAPGPDGQPLDRDKAVAIAEKAAPFMHAKLAHVDASLRSDVTETHRFVVMGAPVASTPAEWESMANYADVRARVIDEIASMTDEATAAAISDIASKLLPTSGAVMPDRSPEAKVSQCVRG